MSTTWQVLYRSRMTVSTPVRGLQMTPRKRIKLAGLLLIAPICYPPEVADAHSDSFRGQTQAGRGHQSGAHTWAP
jgi:hypothetical protein